MPADFDLLLITFLYFYSHPTITILSVTECTLLLNVHCA